MEVLLYATLTCKICHNHIYLYRNHPSPSTATCTPNKHIEHTHSPKIRLLLVIYWFRIFSHKLVCLVLDWIRTIHILIIICYYHRHLSLLLLLLLVLALELVLISTFNLLYLIRNCHAKVTGLLLGGQLMSWTGEANAVLSNRFWNWNRLLVSLCSFECYFSHRFQNAIVKLTNNTSIFYVFFS